MSDDWSRRTLLASLGTAALAGCVADEGADATRTPTQTTVTTSENRTESMPGDGPEPPAHIDSEWPMPDYDSGRSNYAPNAAGPIEPVAELWRVTADTTLSGPVVVDETLYVGGDDGTVRAFDARTGEERWRQSVGAAAGTPWVVDGDLVVSTAEAVVALGASDGTGVWRVETPSREGVLVASHGVYWIAREEPAVVVGLAREDGSKRWRTEIDGPWRPHLFASDESVFVSTGHNSDRPWTLAVQTGDVVGNEPERGYDFPAEECYLEEAVYAVDSFFGNVAALAVDEGGQGWRQGVDALGDYALSGGADHVYYVASGGEEPGLYALSRMDGAIEWTTDAVTSVVGRPVVAGESVLVRSDEALHCFDPSDGTERWAHSGDSIGERLVVVDDLVYTTRGDTVRAFRPP